MTKINHKIIVILAICAIIITACLKLAIDKAVSESSSLSKKEMVSFLNSYGWIVSKEFTEKEVKIPVEFNNVYTNYNDIQRLQGYDLSKYKGERATIFTFEILNFKGREKGVAANIIVFKNKIIGGDISSYELDGFMVGFSGK